MMKRRIRGRKCRFESLETRNLLTVLFADSFEQGANSNDWNGAWVEDSQNDWFRSTQRATDGAHSAEVDGWAYNATLTLANPVDLTGYSSPQLTFDWLIEKGLDRGEYLSLDVSSDGGASWQTDVRRLSGNVDAENTWHGESVDLTPYASANTLVRFRGKASRSNEDADVDNVQITGVPAGPPTVSISDATIAEDQPIETLVAPGSGGLDNPQYLEIGPDDRLYVGSYNTNSVLRYDATTGQFLDVFIPSGLGGLDKPQGMGFGRDGNFYIASGATSNVLRYDAAGTFLGEFVAAGVGGLNDPKGLTWGADGNLYVACASCNSILRFDNAGNPLPGPHGAPGSAEFVPAGSGGLDNVRAIGFGPDGKLYVASKGSGDILRFDSAGGTPEVFIPSGTAGLDDPFGFAFGDDGYFYVGRAQGDEVLRFESATGAFVDKVANAVEGVDQPTGMQMTRDGNLLFANRQKDSVARVSSGVVVSLSHTASSTVTVDFATASGTASAADFTALSGVVTFAPGETTKVILVNATDDAEVEPDETFSVNLSNLIGGGATFADSEAFVTIVDDDASRQVSINDVSEVEGDRTPHYRGAFVEVAPGKNFNDLTFGPDGHLYTSPGPSPTVAPIDRYDGQTGAFLGHFVNDSRINGARDIVFREGYMYVGSEYTDQVLRYNADTGQFVDVFVAAGSGTDGPHGLTFGPDANGDTVPELYVSGRNNATVVRYDGVTGQPLGTFVASRSGGLKTPEGLTFDPSESYLLVTSTTTGGAGDILKYDAATGAFIGVAASFGLNTPKDVKFGPDGLIYVASGGNDRIIRYTESGSYVDDFVPAGSGGMDDPYRLAFDSAGDLFVTALGSNQILRFGSQNEAVFTVTLSTPSNQSITVGYTTDAFGLDPGLRAWTISMRLGRS